MRAPFGKVSFQARSTTSLLDDVTSKRERYLSTFHVEKQQPRFARLVATFEPALIVVRHDTFSCYRLASRLKFAFLVNGSSGQEQRSRHGASAAVAASSGGSSARLNQSDYCDLMKIHFSMMRYSTTRSNISNNLADEYFTIKQKSVIVTRVLTLPTWFASTVPTMHQWFLIDDV